MTAPSGLREEIANLLELAEQEREQAATDNDEMAWNKYRGKVQAFKEVLALLSKQPAGEQCMKGVNALVQPPAAELGLRAEITKKFPVNLDWGHDKLENVLIGAAGLLDTIKGEWAEEWSEWDQSVRNGVTQQLSALNTLREQIRGLMEELRSKARDADVPKCYAYEECAERLNAFAAPKGKP